MSTEVELRRRVVEWFRLGMNRDPTEQEVEGLMRIADGGMPFDVAGVCRDDG